jgi:hypothetical protein
VNASEFARLAIGVFGLGLVVLGLVWRSVRARQERVRLARMLASPEAAMRRQGLARLEPKDLRHLVKELTWVLAYETDPELLRALATIVTDDPWKLTDAPALTRLRLAAHWYLIESPATGDEQSAVATEHAEP